MNNNAGYQPGGHQPAGQTVVMVSSTQQDPNILRRGVKLGGMVLGLGCVACMGLFGGLFLLSGILMLALGDYDHDDFWDDDGSDPTVVVGSIFLVIGLILVAAAVGVAYYARKKYKSGDLSNPGRVINVPVTNTQQPVTPGYDGQPPPAAYPGQPQPAGYGQPQPYGYPAQQHPGGPPAQPPYNPTSAYPGPPAPYPQPLGVNTVQPDPPYPEKTSAMNVTSDYDRPPPTAPDAFSQPPPYQP